MQQPRIRIIEIFSLLILVGLTYGFYQVMRPFILNIFLAAVFTSLLYPLYDRLRSALGDRGAPAGLLVVVMVFVVVAVPVSFIGVLVYSEAIAGYGAVVAQVPELADRLSSVTLLEWAREIPFVGDYVDEIEPVQLSEMLRNGVRTVSNLVLSATQRSFVSVSTALANFVVILLLMFFFFQSGKRLIMSVYDVIPMPNRELRVIAEETRKTTAATLISTLLIGLIEGTYGAVLFLVFGLPSAFLWGLIIVVLSMIPLIGTNLVLVPAGVMLIVSGRVFAGVAMIALGLGGVAVTQNVIKPKLLGDRSGLHPALALLSTIGGIAWLGLVGFLVGPLIATLFIVVWQQFAIRYRHELDERDRVRSSPDAHRTPDPGATESASE